ncbi:MAG: hypothetical protein WBM53_11710 [Maribacter sp.]
MAHILKNKNLEIHIDPPLENYNSSRFDWTGKIVKVKFRNILVSGTERMDWEEEQHLGKGFYTEFGIDTPLGFDEAKIGGWFHKIGVGLLKKDDNQYIFNKAYEIKPAQFKTTTNSNKIIIECKSQAINGYSYLLKKEIELFESSFVINYFLQNTGTKPIITNEYNHNFVAINKDSIGKNYILKFPFQLKPKLFGEIVNPERKVDIGLNEIKFNGLPKEQFFFSNLSGDETVDAGWELINLKNKIGISETGSFKTIKVNLWGWEHVISPELFFNMDINSGQSIKWSRTYNLFKIE